MDPRRQGRGVAAVVLAEGDFDAVIAADAHLLQLAGELGDGEYEALAYAGIGQAAWARGDYDGASEALSSSVSAAQRAGAEWVEAVESGEHAGAQVGPV
ncbi:MAG: hypothetical protein M3Q47_16680 [Actinomycetota bacterium]|nr:hypothetical protein [Actinomycetota bacterium]